METKPIDLPRFRASIIDDGYIVLWSKSHQKWLRVHAVDGKAGLANGTFSFESPDGSEPDVELTRSAFRKR